MVAVVSAILALYLVWLLWLLIMVWRQDRLPVLEREDAAITVITAFKNELAVLPGLVFSLKKQPQARFRWIAVDDGSTDGSADYVRQETHIGHGLDVMQVNNANLPGKRGAIATAVPLAETEWLLQTDADCRAPTTWVAHAGQAARQGRGVMAIFPLRFRTDHESRFWLSVVNTEFASVMAVTCAMARAGKPVMCNGANLAYKKDFWQEAAPHLEAQTHVGGDDMFLLDYAVHHRQPVTYNDASGLWVETESPLNLPDFLAQRRRWAAKWSAYRSKWPALIGAFTVCGQGSFVSAFFVLELSWTSMLGYLILGKMALEGMLLARQLHKGGMDFKLKAFLFWQIAYLPYILIAALPSLWSRQPARWKN